MSGLVIVGVVGYGNIAVAQPTEPGVSNDPDGIVCVNAKGNHRYSSQVTEDELDDALGQFKNLPGIGFGADPSKIPAGQSQKLTVNLWEYDRDAGTAVFQKETKVNVSCESTDGGNGFSCEALEWIRGNTEPLLKIEASWNRGVFSGAPNNAGTGTLSRNYHNSNKDLSVYCFRFSEV